MDEWTEIRDPWVTDVCYVKDKKAGGTTWGLRKNPGTYAQRSFKGFQTPVLWTRGLLVSKGDSAYHMESWISPDRWYLPGSIVNSEIQVDKRRDHSLRALTV